jgi:wyosine [tRNA(Phe)-imidazoG37] synthetase (radical SAM superfamily)
MIDTEVLCKVMTYTYGPVASWRFGRSLGVDILMPPKKCTFNCVYCQLGHTMQHVSIPEEIQNDIPKTKDIILDVRKSLEKIDRKDIDVLTFSGTGEPTLNPNIGLIESEIREILDDLPIILLTNASLLPRDSIRKKVKNFDIVTAKYDAGDETTFKRINRPAKGAFKLHEIQDGIKQLHADMKGTLALEVMLLTGSKGLSNVVGSSRKSLIEGIIDVNPDIVQIYTPWRPSAVQSIRPVSEKVILEFGREIEDHFGPEALWIYGIHDARGKDVNWKTHHTLEREILELLKRRPCEISDITTSLGSVTSIVTSVLDNLQHEGIVKTSRVENKLFYTISETLLKKEIPI